jgi:signal transduction histidine kinase
LLEIEKSAYQCKKIVESLLRFSRDEKHDLSIVSLNNLLEESLTLVQHQISMSNINIIKNLNKDFPPVLGNSSQLQQVFVNIIKNAVQSMPNGGELKIESLNTENSIKIKFSDTGCGIKNSLIPLIFEPFFTTKEVGEGVGLGLSISYQIIKKHNGSIDVKSSEGKGSTFIVSLPIYKG